MESDEKEFKLSPPPIIKIKEEYEGFDEYQLDMETDYFMQHNFLKTEKNEVPEFDDFNLRAYDFQYNSEFQFKGDVDASFEEQECVEEKVYHTENEGHQELQELAEDGNMRNEDEEGEIKDSEQDDESGFGGEINELHQEPLHLLNPETEKGPMNPQAALNNKSHELIEQKDQNGSDMYIGDITSKEITTTTSNVTIESSNGIPLAFMPDPYYELVNSFSPVSLASTPTNGSTRHKAVDRSKCEIKPNVEKVTSDRKYEREEKKIKIEKTGNETPKREEITRARRPSRMGFMDAINLLQQKVKAYEIIHENSLSVLPTVDSNWLAFLICERAFCDKLSPCYIVGHGEHKPCQILTLRSNVGVSWEILDVGSIRLPNESIFLAEARREIPEMIPVLYLIDAVFLNEIPLFDQHFDSRQRAMKESIQKFNLGRNREYKIRINDPIWVGDVPEKMLNKFVVETDSKMVYRIPNKGAKVFPSGILFINKKNSIFDFKNGNVLSSPTSKSFLWIFTSSRQKSYFSFKDTFDRSNLLKKYDKHSKVRKLSFFIRLKGFIHRYWSIRERIFNHGHSRFPGSALSRRLKRSRSSESPSPEPHEENLISTLRHPISKPRFFRGRFSRRSRSSSSQSHHRRSRSRSSRRHYRSRSRSHRRSRSRSSRCHSQSRSSSYNPRRRSRHESGDISTRPRSQDIWVRSPDHPGYESGRPPRLFGNFSARFGDQGNEPKQNMNKDLRSESDMRKLIEKLKMGRNTQMHCQDYEYERRVHLGERDNTQNGPIKAHYSLSHHSRHSNESYRKEMEIRERGIEGRWHTPRSNPSTDSVQDFSHNDEDERQTLFFDEPIPIEKPYDFQDEWLNHKQKMKELNRTEGDNGLFNQNSGPWNQNGHQRARQHSSRSSLELAEETYMESPNYNDLRSNPIESNGENREERKNGEHREERRNGDNREERRNGQSRRNRSQVERHCVSETLRTIRTSYSYGKVEYFSNHVLENLRVEINNCFKGDPLEQKEVGDFDYLDMSSSSSSEVSEDPNTKNQSLFQDPKSTIPKNVYDEDGSVVFDYDHFDSTAQ